MKPPRQRRNLPRIRRPMPAAIGIWRFQLSEIQNDFEELPTFEEAELGNPARKAHAMA